MAGAGGLVGTDGDARICCSTLCSSEGPREDLFDSQETYLFIRPGLPHFRFLFGRSVGSFSDLPLALSYESTQI